mmetsp:Transcript_19470/g.40104  ORF Transcript_19470/g.40104 Transcript_19470/m.40104 type:complete len:272 (+) Transcript_19470:843-1658(+)
MARRNTWIPPLPKPSKRKIPPGRSSASNPSTWKNSSRSKSRSPSWTCNNRKRPRPPPWKPWNSSAPSRKNKTGAAFWASSLATPSRTPASRTTTANRPRSAATLVLRRCVARAGCGSSTASGTPRDSSRRSRFPSTTPIRTLETIPETGTGITEVFLVLVRFDPNRLSVTSFCLVQKGKSRTFGASGPVCVPDNRRQRRERFPTRLSLTLAMLAEAAARPFVVKTIREERRRWRATLSGATRRNEAILDGRNGSSAVSHGLPLQSLHAAYY